MRIAILLSVMAAPAVAQDLDGYYHWSGTDPVQGCDRDAYNDGSIEVSGDRIFFIESACTLSNPTAVRDMPEAILYDAKCSGEGETWVERMFVYQTFDGVAVLSRGAARSYRRCE